MRNKIIAYLGIITAICSIFFVIAAISDIVRPDEDMDTPIGVLIGLMVFFSLTTSGGVYLGVSNLRNAKRIKYEQEEKKLLELIKEKEGRITPAEVGLNTSSTIAEAQKKLDRLCANGFGEVQVTSEGRLVYVFWGFIPEKEKETSKNPLEAY